MRSLFRSVGVTPPPVPVPGKGRVGIAPRHLLGVRAIGLLPVPAALMILRDDGSIGFVGANQAFDATGLGPSAPGSPVVNQLGDRIRAFIASDRLSDEWQWQWGDAVERRHYLVSLARLKVKSGGRFLLTLVDQTAERRTERNMRREMLTDSLSGLPNRAGFSDVLEVTFGAPDADRSRYAVLIVDLARFARINACLGSLAGDELLITVARRLKGALRGRDVLARTGGDEFGILMTLDDGPGDADLVARRIQGAMALPFKLSDYEIRVSCSIGVAFGSADITDPEDLIRHAQFSVKRAKASGLVETYQSRAHDQARRQFGLETELRRTIENGALTLAYQPIWDLASGEIVKFEALARWTTEDGTEVNPQDFIQVAEESGLIVPLGRWAIDEAARTMASWDAAQGQPCNVGLTVNVSAIQLQRDDIASLVERALAAYDLTGDRFTLELTESVLVSEGDLIGRTMHAVKALGAQIAMDDFGTGYSNLAYLQKLPIDLLKIDRSFVTGMLADRDKISIVRAILSLAQALGLRACAEGIETQELAQTLAALGCTFGQGYLYSPPVQADEAYRLFMSRRAAATTSSAMAVTRSPSGKFSAIH